jgi:hypothetical protein
MSLYAEPVSSGETCLMFEYELGINREYNAIVPRNHRQGAKSIYGLRKVVLQLLLGLQLIDAPHHHGLHEQSR